MEIFAPINDWLRGVWSTIPKVQLTTNSAIPIKADNDGHLQVDVLSGSLGGGHQDDTSFSTGTDTISGMGALYNSPVAELGTNKLGALRATNRRALLTGTDYVYCFGTQLNVSIIGDIEVSTTDWDSGFAAPTTADLDGSDAGFGADPRYFRIPMAGWRDVSIWIKHALGVAIDVKIHARLTSEVYDPDMVLIASQSLSGGTEYHYFSPYAGGTGADANYHQVAALQMPCNALIVEFAPTADPSTGHIHLVVGRRT